MRLNKLLFWNEGTVYSRRLAREIVDRSVDEVSCRVQMEDEEIILEEAAREYDLD